MTYTLRYSDPTNTDTIHVPDYVPGINTIDTSLSLVGKGYPAYGQKVAENFLHLLENFASPVPPQNPIKGQLWYDTSNPNNKVLRINDGTVSGANWPSANGIYQQPIDPKLYGGAGLNNGDIWVDTENVLLNIYNGGKWHVVGPTTSGVQKTGAESAILTDASTNVDNRVILNWADGYVVSVVSSAVEFTPKTYPAGMEGFSSIVPGITLTGKPNFKIQGVVSDSVKLGGVLSSNYLQKNDASSIGQVITGKVVYETPGTGSPEGYEGVIVRIATQPKDEYIQFYKQGDNAIISNNKQAGQIVFKVKGSTDANLSNAVYISKNSVGINTSTDALTALSVVGSVKISSTLTTLNIVTTNTTIIADASVGGNLTVAGVTTAIGGMHLGSSSGSGDILLPNKTQVYNIGSSALSFNNLYATNLYSNRIQSVGPLQITGSVVIGGNLTVNDSPVNSTGTMILFAGSTSTGVPSGWTVCDGSTSTIFANTGLFSVIGYRYGKYNNSYNQYINLNARASTGSNTLVLTTNTNLKIGDTVSTSTYLLTGTSIVSIGEGTVTLGSNLVGQIPNGTSLSFSRPANGVFYLPNLYTTSTMGGTSTFATTYYIIKT
jgi:hypothetical protein